MALSSESLDSPRMRQFVGAIDGAYRQPYVRVTPSGCVLAQEFMNSAQDILDFEVRPDDVWLVTYPKCGTTWNQELIWLLMNDFDFEEANKTALIERSPFIELTAILPIFRKVAPDSFAACQKAKSPRLIKSHLPLQLLPTQLWTVKPKIIYVVRGVKDVIVSYYHHYNLWSETKMTLDEFGEYFIEDLPMYCPFWTHVLDFWKIRNEPNVLFYSYEDMKKDLESVIRRVASFLGRPMLEDKMPRMLEHLSIGQMRQNRKVNYDPYVEDIRRESRLPPAQGKAFVRSGKVGEGLTSFSESVRNKIDTWTEDCLRGTDYTGPR